MLNFIYPAKLTPDKDDGGFVVMFRDFPEAITQGENIDDALTEAVDCLEEAFANRIASSLPIPAPSKAKRNDHLVFLPAQMSAKAALYLAMNDLNITKAELAKRLRCDEKEIRRLISPRHPSKLPRIEAALAALGKHLIVGLQEAV
jgi:antitoxin HicB